MKLVLINGSGQQNITHLVSRVTWSGEYTQVARKLEFTIIVSPSDYYLPRTLIMPGDMVRFYDQEVQLFEGYVFSKEKSNNNNVMTVTAYDGGIYLLKNEGAYNFKNITAEAIAKKVCGDFNIPVGDIAETGIAQNLLCVGDSLYDVIMKAYTKAAEQNGKKYIMLMLNGKMNIIERGSLAVDYILDDNKDLTNSAYSESIENMVNTVKIVNEVGDTNKSSTTTITWDE